MKGALDLLDDSSLIASARTKARPTVRSVEWILEPLSTQPSQFFEPVKFDLLLPHLKRRSLPPGGLAWHDFDPPMSPIKYMRCSDNRKYALEDYMHNNVH